MKKILLILCSVLALALSVAGQVQLREATANEITAGTAGFPAVVTPKRLVGYGGFDPLAASYASKRGITNKAAIARLSRFVERLRYFTNSMPVFHYDFNPDFNPSNHVDLFGRTNLTFYGPEVYTDWGIQYRQTNGVIITLPATLTNFTVFITRRNPNFADAYLMTGTPEAAINNRVGLDFSFETAGTSAGHYFGGSDGFTRMKCWQTDGTNYPASKNFNNSPPYFLGYASLTDGAAPVLQSCETIFCYSSDCNGTDKGFLDIRPLTSNGSTNLSIGGATNFLGMNEIHLGWSTNFFNWSNTRGWNGNTTNGGGEVFSVTVYSNLVSWPMVTNYFAAAANLQKSKSWVIFAGTSMMQEKANRTYTASGFSPYVFTNCWPYYAAISAPTKNYRNYSQGGSSLGTFTNNPIVGPEGTMWPLLTVCRLLSDGEREIEVVTDYPRNDWPTNYGINFDQISQSLAATFNPVKRFASLTLVESVLAATNSINVVCHWMNNSNFATGTANVRTNPATLLLPNRVVSFQNYFSGSDLSTNSLYFMPDSSGGFHIENTNSALILKKQAYLFNNGQWPNAFGPQTNSVFW